MLLLFSKYIQNLTTSPHHHTPFPLVQAVKCAWPNWPLCFCLASLESVLLMAVRTILYKCEPGHCHSSAQNPAMAFHVTWCKNKSLYGGSIGPSLPGAPVSHGIFSCPVGSCHTSLLAVPQIFQASFHFKFFADVSFVCNALPSGMCLLAPLFKCLLLEELHLALLSHSRSPLACAAFSP